MTILVLNAGSSSLKFGLFQPSRPGDDDTVRQLFLRDQPVSPADEGTMAVAAEQVLRTVTETLTVDAVGCRVVHGGDSYTAATRVNPPVLSDIRAMAKLAPLHNPIDAAVIEAALRVLTDVPVVAVFDTAFHHNLPKVAAAYALPLTLRSEYPLRRYGFHGISHAHIAGRMSVLMPQPEHDQMVVSCHLGNGASVCALRAGQSVDTSMGFTPMEGLVMGTRSGDIDPGLLVYLLRHEGVTPERLDRILNHESGLLGVSGVTANVGELEKVATAGNEAAEFALELFAYRVCKYIGAYATVLGGLNAVTFTGGIGERSPNMRARICKKLGFLGVNLDEEHNSHAQGGTEVRISPDYARVQVWVIPAGEEAQIAREVIALLK